MKKVIIQISNDMISEKLKQGLSIDETIQFFRDFEPKTKIEKRVIQRSICILNGYNMQLAGQINNPGLLYLVNCLY